MIFLNGKKAQIKRFSLIVFIVFIINMIAKTTSKLSANICTKTSFYFSDKVKGFDIFPLQHYEIGQRLDRYLKSTAIGWSSTQKHLRNGNIKVLSANGSVIKNNGHKFQQGDQLLLKQNLGLQQLLIGDKNINHIEMDFNLAKSVLDDMLIFDNQNIAIVNKPQGFSVQGGPQPNRNLFSLMAARYRKEMVYISHRLDKPTTGIVLLPKNLKTAQILGKALQTREGIDKFYLAITEGSEIRQKSGSISCHIEWTNKHRAKISQEITGNDRSQESQTMFFRLNKIKLSDILWRHILGLKLITGRKHQIRCQLSQYFLNPIINDELYLGRKEKDCDQAIYLHAFGLKISDQKIIQQVLKLNTTQQQISNKSGSLVYNENQVTILANPSQHWLKYTQEISNQILLQVIKNFTNSSKMQKPKKLRTSKII